MEGNRRPSSKKRPYPEFKNKGGNRRGKRQNPSREPTSGDSHASDTVYRILCHSRKIGSVIGKGGSIVKALREATRAKITVADSVHGSDERVIIIHSPSTQPPTKNKSNDEDPDEDPKEDPEEDLMIENKDVSMEPHCAAQDALLKVHDRIIEEDLAGEDDNETVVTARLLVPNNMVGCVLGKKGDVINRLRTETGASIRVLPSEQLPTCAMSTDELVQISAKPAVAKRALYEVSTLLHQNPRKDKPPSSFPMPYGGQGFHPSGQRHSDPHGMPPMPWMEEYGNQPSGFGPGRFNDVPAAHGGEAPSEFSMKILCSVGKIGGVIGKGGLNVKQLQQETRASIHVDDASEESEERVIRVSSLEVPWDPRSQTIEAILQLQDRTSEYSEKGIITTRLLVPSSKVGCILGQGGHVINEMRRRTQADIRIYSKEDKPKCAAQNEELVQISGVFGVAKDALVEIASRLRARCLRDANAGTELPPVGPHPGFGPIRNSPGRVPRSSRYTGPGSSRGYELVKGGGYEYDRPSYPVRPSAAGYPNFDRSMDVKFPSNVGSIAGKGWSDYSEISGTRLKLQDPQLRGSECVVDIRGSSDHLNAARNIHKSFTASTEQNNHYSLSSYENTNYSHSSYQNTNSQQSAYSDINTSQAPYQSSYTDQSQYPSIYAQQDPYQNTSAQQAPYENIGAQSSYQY